MIKSSKAFLATLTGVASGIAIGILVAPDKGSKTRKKISQKGDDYLQDIKKELSDIRNDLNKKVGKTKEEMKNLREKGMAKSQEIKEEVKSTAKKVGEDAKEMKEDAKDSAQKMKSEAKETKEDVKHEASKSTSRQG